MSSGRWMPVDLPPKKLIVKDADGPHHAVCDCYETHFNSCPNAAQHRKPAIAKDTMGYCPDCKETYSACVCTKRRVGNESD